MDTPIYDLIIIGGGPAGTAAAVYAARKQLKTLMIVAEWGGQSTVSLDIENWIGTPHISGYDLMKSFKAHVKEYKGEFLTVLEDEYVQSISKADMLYEVSRSSTKHLTRSILITTGSHRRKLDVPGADKLEHHGLTYCASCDGPLYKGKDVVVVGGGNAGFDAAAQLVAYCTSVTLLSRGVPRAEAITVEALKKCKNFNLVTGATPTEIHGDTDVRAISYRTQDEVKTVDTQGVFIEIGQLPSTDFASHMVNRTESNHIIIDPRTQKTSAYNIWAAGDCTDVLYHQNNIAAGDAVRALEDIYLTLKKQS